MAYDYINFSCQLSSTYNSPGLYATLADCENAVNDGSVRPVLILNPLWTANKRVSLPLIVSALGDGYKQTVFQGLTENEEWDITSPLLTGTEVSQLLNQLQKLSADSFLWSPNNGVIEWREYTCDEWQKIRIGVNQYQITTKFTMTILGSGLIISDTPVNPLDPFAANVVLFLKGDGTNGSTSIIDSSPNPKAITVNGNAQISTAQSKYGGSSIFFDGTGDGLTTPDSEDWNFTGDFTVEAWVYATAFTNFGIIVGQHGGFGENSNRSFCLRQESSQKFEILRSFNGSNVFELTNPSNFLLNTWYHVAATRQGSTYRLFVNGIQVATDSNASVLFNSTYPLSIGAAQNLTDNWQGYIDSLRITKGVARYTANFNPETDTYLNL